jgi:hypothetical protein
MSARSNDVKRCEDVTWRFRLLFASTMFRLCRAPAHDEGNKDGARKYRDTAAYCPDALGNVRVDDVLMQQWNKHMGAADAHLDRVLQLSEDWRFRPAGSTPTRPVGRCECTNPRNKFIRLRCLSL